MIHVHVHVIQSEGMIELTLPTYFPGYIQLISVVIYTSFALSVYSQGWQRYR